MAINIGELFWKIKADTSDIEKSTKKTEGRISKLGKALITAFSGAAVIAGVRKLAGFLKEAGEAAAIQESAVRRLGAALEVTGQSGGNALGELQEFASELQAITVVGDEATLALLQTAINMGLSKDEAKTATEQAIALSRAYGIDMNTALIGVTNTLAGQTSTLTRYIPSLKTAGDATERIAILNEEAGKAMAIAREEIETAAGTQIQLSNAIGDSHELIGNYVNERLTPWRQRLKDIVTEANNALAAQQNLDAALTGDAAANFISALEEQGNKVRELAAGIEEGGTAALRLARHYQVHTNQLGEQLKIERQKFDVLQRISGARTRDQTTTANQAAEQQAALEEEIRLEEERLRLLDEEAERLRGIEDARVAGLQGLAEAELANEEFIKELRGQNALALAEGVAFQMQLEQERHDQRIANLQAELQAASQQAGNIGTIFSNLINAQLAGDDELTDKKKKNIIALYRIQQAASVAQIAIDTAAAIVRAWASPGFPLAIPLTAVIAGIGATQAAVAIATPPPVALADGGIVPARPGGTTAVIGEAGRDEAVIPLDDTGAFGSMRIIVNLDGQPILDTVQSGINRREIVVDAGSVV